MKWEGCYDDSWKGVIVADAFSHPAKFSKALVERIIDHMVRMGWLVAGDLIGDPFGGVGLGGIIAAYRRMRWIGVELESRFVDLGRRNFLLHESRWRWTGVTLPVLLRGDSRAFDHVLSSADALITSPPYISGGHHNDVFDSWNTLPRGGQRITKNKAGYGKENGQIGTLKDGSVDAVVTSPPFQSARSGTTDSCGGIAREGYTGKGKREPRLAERQPHILNPSEGNIASCGLGKVDAVLTSPPYEGIAAGAGGLNTKPAKKAGQQSGRKASASQVTDQHYGKTEGQIGLLKKETYWEAMLQVYSAMYQSLKPTGVAAIVVKDFVRDGKRMRLCDDTVRLIEHVGFETLERIHAMLTHEYILPDLFEGSMVKRTNRKSFFRRNFESNMAKDDPRRIDWEEVIFVRKPC